jgi:hypothetical protein
MTILGKLMLGNETDSSWILDNQAFQGLRINTDSTKKSLPAMCYVLENERMYGPDFIFKKSDITRI